MTLPKVDTERFTLVRKHLYTAVLGDVLDQLGRTHQFLPQGIQALHPDMVLVGRAMPLLITDVFETQRSPFGRLTEALDQLEPGDVYLARSGRAQCAAWGEILTATARARGAAGAVIDGFHRDTVRILEQDWPVFSRGRFAQDAGVRASVVDYRVPLEIDGVRVNPGDLIVGDIDGVVVVPSAVENEVLERALVKATAENMVRQAIEGGMSSTKAFATYGVL
jgi:4-hydroxy-4-methyl-2-oxoglutarate aldolase